MASISGFRITGVFAPAFTSDPSWLGENDGNTPANQSVTTGISFSVSDVVETFPLPISSESILGYIPWGQGLTNQFYTDPIFIPEPIQLGNILADSSLTVQIFNSSLLSKLVTSITASNMPGVTVTPQSALPFSLDALGYLDVVIDTTFAGPAEIDGTITAIVGGYSLVVRVLGTRSVVIKQLANWKSSVDETLEFKTVVGSAYGGKEQRRGMRSFPRRSLKYSIIAMKETDAAYLENSLYANQDKNFSIPVAVDYSKVTQEAASGQNVVYCDPEYFSATPGQNIMLYSSDGFEAAQIQTVNTDNIVLSANLNSTWGVGAKVYPVSVGHLKAAQTVARETDKVVTANLEVNLSVIEYQSNLPDGSASMIYDGLEVLLLSPDWGSKPTIQFTNNFDTFGSDGSGLLEYIGKRNYTVPIRNYKWQFNSREAVKFFRAFLKRCDGRRVPFWMPSRMSDFKLVADIIGGTAYMQIEDNGFYGLSGLTENRQDVAIFIRGQSQPMCLRISTLTLNVNGSINFQFASSFSSNIPISDVVRICLLEKVRLGSDTVIIKWQANLRGSCSLNLVVVEA